LHRLPLLPLPTSFRSLSGPRCSVSLLLILPLMGQGLPGSTPRPAALTQESESQRRERPVQAASTASTAVAPGPYRITPERRALLDTIRYAEGTWISGSPEGYRVLYGGGRFQGLERHPEIVVSRGYTSAAAGAYQFLPDTWKEAARKLRLPDFAPASQDQAALYLVEKRGALAAFDRQGLSAEVLHRLAPEWASLPTHLGESHYGQPVKDAEDLKNFYGARLILQRRSATA
jgi:lysozyme